jgi:hypothetical protein
MPSFQLTMAVRERKNDYRKYIALHSRNHTFRAEKAIARISITVSTIRPLILYALRVGLLMHLMAT